MSKRAMIPLVIGLAVGVVAIKLAMDVVSKAKGSGTREGGVMVVLAKSPISREHAISEDQLKVVEVAKDLVPDQAFSDPVAVVGRVAAQHVPMGMFISEIMLRPPGAKPGIAAAIPPGYRAVAVKVDEYSAVGNWLQPDSRVDLLVVMNVRKGRRTTSESRVVLRDVKILAVGTTLDATGKTGVIKGRSVTLLVPTEDAKKVHLATTRGRIRFAMRGQEGGDVDDGLKEFEEDEFDKDPEPKPAPKPSFLASLLGGMTHASAAGTAAKPPLAVASAHPQPERNMWTVEIIGGRSKTETLRFAGPRSSTRMGGASVGLGLTDEKTLPIRDMPEPDSTDKDTDAMEDEPDDIQTDDGPIDPNDDS